MEREIVGVAGDVQQQLFTTPGVTAETVYLPQAQSPVLAHLVLEARGDPQDLVNPLRDEAHAVDQDLTLPTVLTMDEFVGRSFVGIRVFNAILGGFGILALVLAAMGTSRSRRPRPSEVAATLTEIERRLLPADFVRIHRSHIVNLRQVSRIKPYDERRLRLELADGSAIVASRRGSAELKERMR